MSRRNPSLWESLNPIELVTPGEIRAYVDNVNAAYIAFNNDVQKSNSLTSSDETAWNLLFQNEKKFYASVGFFSTLTLGTMRTAEEFARLLTTWREKFQKTTGRAASGVAVNIPSENNLLDVKNIGFIVGGLVLLYGLSIAAPWLRAAAPAAPIAARSTSRLQERFYGPQRIGR